MRRLIGVLDLCLGGLALVAVIVAATGLPAAWQDFSVEPEDLYSLILLLALSGVVGFAAMSAGQRLIRGRAGKQVSWVIPLSLLAAVLLAVASVAGFVDEEPSSFELRYLLLPAAVLAWSAYLLRKRSSLTEPTPG